MKRLLTLCWIVQLSAFAFLFVHSFAQSPPIDKSVEGNLHSNRIMASQTIAAAANESAIGFDYLDKRGLSTGHFHSIPFQAFNPKAPHDNWAQMDADKKGVTVHVRTDSGWWLGNGRILVKYP